MHRYFQTGPFHPSLEAGFCEATLRRAEALAPTYVVVPTHVLGQHLMRTIARQHGMCFNVRFRTFPDLADTVAISDLVASRRLPLPPLADFLIARKVIKERITTGRYLEPVRDYPGLPHAVLTTVMDLKKAMIAPAQLRQVAEESGSQKLAELSDLYQEIEREQQESGYFDWSERLAAASQAAHSSPLLTQTSAVCLYGFADLNALERRLFASCIDGRPAYVFVPEDVGGHAQPLIDWLKSQGFQQAPSPAAAAAPPETLARELFQEAPRVGPVGCDVRIISAPGEGSEIAELTRQILTFVETADASFSDIAVLLRHPAAYERTIRDVFDRADIPYVFLDGIPLRDTLAGRLLRLLVRIRKNQYPRAEMLEFLGLAPLRPRLLRADPSASPADWDRYSREAGIVGGIEHWGRLPSLRRRFEWRVKQLREEAEGEPAPPEVAQLERDLRSLQAFTSVSRLLLKRLSAMPDRATIGALIAGLARTLHTMTALSKKDREALGWLWKLAKDRVAGEEVTLETFAGLVDDLLAERVPPEEVYRHGRVVVSSLNRAVGLPFKLVLIPGMVERSFPPPARQDPILLDEEREALNRTHGTALVTRDRHAVEEQFAFRHAVGAAGERLVFSFPRLDAVTGQVRVPSHYLLRLAESLRGEPVEFKALETLADRIPVGLAAGRAPALTVTDWDLALVSQAVDTRTADGLAGLPGVTAMARGILAEDRRWGVRRFTEYDGVLDVPVSPPATMAATRLETYGTCPFRFFGERILRVQEIDEPEEVDTISPLDRGALIHSILKRLFTDLTKRQLLPVRESNFDDCLSRAYAIAEEEFAEFERSGAVGYPFMWRVERTRILADLQGLLTNELADDSGFLPTYFEVGFGHVPRGVTASPGSMPAPLDLSVGGEAMRFTGKIDRIDLDNERARVVDYKTGGIYGERPDSFRGGQSLQLPLYIHAADAILAHNNIHAHVAGALYYYATAKGGYRRVEFSREALEVRAGEFATILRTMRRGIAAGMFPQRPGKNGDHCTYCDYTPVCGHWRGRLVERKEGDPAIRLLRAMWEIE